SSWRACAPKRKFNPDRNQRSRGGRRVSRQDIRALLHDQAERNGHGLGDLPVDRRISRRAGIGGGERAAWRDGSLYLANRNEVGGMTTDDHIVFIVDDDARIREAVSELLESHGIRAVTFGSAGEYVRADKPDLPASLILDVELPDINGLDLQKQIAEGDHPPHISVTGHGDIPSAVRAIKDGAVDFLTKPFSDGDLMRAVRVGLAQDEKARLERAEMAVLRERHAALTPRERDVLPLVVSGLLNKQAAAELGISEVMLQIHRRNVMQKLAAASLADLV